MNYTGPKVRLSRKLGVAITSKAGRIMESKPYPPGQHGPNNMNRRRMSNYKTQLLEKQRLKAQYNIHERQLVNYYKKALLKAGDTSQNLIQILEMRLDAVVHRGSLAVNIYAARQLVSHGHIMVNGEKVNYPAFQVKVGDVVSVRERSRRLDLFSDSLRNSNPPAYLALSKPELTVKVMAIPARQEIPVVCELSQVIEYYSK